MQQSVVVEEWPYGVVLAAYRQRDTTSVYLAVGCLGGDPVFEAVDGNGGFRIIGDHEEPGHARLSKLGEADAVARPPYDFDIHTPLTSGAPWCEQSTRVSALPASAWLFMQPT
jgi:hypothetical protein